MVLFPLRTTTVILSVVLPLSGCADWPDLSDPPGVADAAPPRIAPLPEVLGSVASDTAALSEETGALQARAASLRARAEAVGRAP